MGNWAFLNDEEKDIFMDNENSQGTAETMGQRARRMPHVIRAYKRDMEKYGRPLDSGLPSVLEFVAKFLEECVFDDNDTDRPESKNPFKQPAQRGAEVTRIMVCWNKDCRSTDGERGTCLRCGNGMYEVTVPSAQLDDAQIKHMVDRFLGWKLPKPWHPDGGISYALPQGYVGAAAEHHWPNGTNLFDAEQATAMVRYMLDGLKQS